MKRKIQVPLRNDKGVLCGSVVRYLDEAEPVTTNQAVSPYVRQAVPVIDPDID